MKTKIFRQLTILIVFIFVSTTAISQTPSYIENGNDEHQYQISTPVPALPQGVFYSYLWWFGDNGFRFDSMPAYTHFDRVITTTTTNNLLVLTENYGTAGPPPANFTTDRHTNAGVPFTVLTQGNSLLLQNYRNPVPNDSLYLILTYKNNTENTLNGNLRLELDPALTVVNSFGATYPQVYPNGETFVQGTSDPTWSFQNLKPNMERSILILVYVSPAADGDVNMRAYLEAGSPPKEPLVNGQDFYEIVAGVENSHDPNMMGEDSDGAGLCTKDEDTITYRVKFQNIGDGPTRYVKVVSYLDDKVDLSTIHDVTFPARYGPQQIQEASLNGYNLLDNNVWAVWDVDQANKTISFEMNQIILRSVFDPGVTNLDWTRDEVSFKIKVKSNYKFGPETKAYSEITFDDNDMIQTDTVSSACMDPLPLDNGGGFTKPDPINISGYPTWVFVVGGVVALGLIILVIGRFRRKK